MGGEMDGLLARAAHAAQLHAGHLLAEMGPTGLDRGVEVLRIVAADPSAAAEHRRAAVGLLARFVPGRRGEWLRSLREMAEDGSLEAEDLRQAAEGLAPLERDETDWFTARSWSTRAIRAGCASSCPPIPLHTTWTPVRVSTSGTAQSGDLWQSTPRIARRWRISPTPLRGWASERPAGI